MSLLELFCAVDDFCIRYETEQARQLVSNHRKRGPKPTLSASEVMTIVIWFHCSGYRNFKSYYQDHVCVHLRAEFPELVSYTRFVELMPTTLLPLCIYLKSRFGLCTGISFVDSTPLPVCHNRRIKRHKVFADQARRGKTSMGWFYGFKLHLAVTITANCLASRSQRAMSMTVSPCLNSPKHCLASCLVTKGIFPKHCLLSSMTMASN